METRPGRLRRPLCEDERWLSAGNALPAPVDVCRTVPRQALRRRSGAWPRSCRRRAGSGRCAGGGTVNPSGQALIPQMAAVHCAAILPARAARLPRADKFTPIPICPQLIGRPPVVASFVVSTDPSVRISWPQLSAAARGPGESAQASRARGGRRPALKPWPGRGCGPRSPGRHHESPQASGFYGH